MKIDIRCAECGSNRFNYPLKFTGSSVIKCAACGHVIGTVSEIQRKVIEQMTGSSSEQAN